MKKLIAFMASTVISSTLFLSAVVGPAAAAEGDCGSSGCSVTFEYTGSVEAWPVPAGITSVRFEVFGAAGGGGSGGGRVAGTLHNLPATLYLVVGGVGAIGNRAEGGFNGGGRSGASNGSSGSGGGASEIRFSSSRYDELVIAGGGGGQGSNGGAGGLGGGLIGGTGQPGLAGAGGQGGTQSSGGLEGEPTKQYGGVAGISGQGGVGGSSSGMSPMVGGGGGGGGHYGGGGGAGSSDAQSTGSGGGGGSSFARESHTSDVVHEQGVRAGNGLIVLRYGATPSVASFSGSQSSATGAEFSLDFGAPVAGLGIDDFSIQSGNGCRIDSVTGGPARYSIFVSSCNSSPVRLALAANSVSIDESGPASAATVSLEMSIGEPRFTLTGNPTSSAGDFNFDVQHGAEVLPLKLDDFEIAGCSASIKVISTGTRLVFRDCPDGTVRITLKANSIRDSFGNSGPSADITRSVRVDGARPTLRLQLLASAYDSAGLETVRVRLIASEPISLRVASLSVSPAGSCRIIASGSGAERTLSIGDCANGSYRLVLPAGVVADQAGWFAPTSQQTLAFDVTAGVKTDVAAPTPTPTSSVAPWVPIDLTTDAETQLTEPVVVPDGAASPGVELESAEDELTMWLVPGGLSLLFLAIALLLMRRRKRQESAEDDGAAAVEKYSVFGKPADGLR